MTKCPTPELFIVQEPEPVETPPVEPVDLAPEPAPLTQVKPACSESDGRFQWNDEDLDVICHYQPRTCTYWNGRGQAVIRQEADWPHEEHDPYVFVSGEHLPALIEALRRMLKEANE